MLSTGIEIIAPALRWKEQTNKVDGCHPAETTSTGNSSCVIEAEKTKTLDNS
jgi:hypothetical protein